MKKFIMYLFNKITTYYKVKKERKIQKAVSLIINSKDNVKFSDSEFIKLYIHELFTNGVKQYDIEFTKNDVISLNGIEYRIIDITNKYYENKDKVNITVIKENKEK